MNASRFASCFFPPFVFTVCDHLIRLFWLVTPLLRGGKRQSWWKGSLDVLWYSTTHTGLAGSYTGTAIYLELSFFFFESVDRLTTNLGLFMSSSLLCQGRAEHPLYTVRVVCSMSSCNFPLSLWSSVGGDLFQCFTMWPFDYFSCCIWWWWWWWWTKSYLK